MRKNEKEPLLSRIIITLFILLIFKGSARERGGLFWDGGCVSVLHLLGRSSALCRRCSFWERSRERWWQSCRRLLSESCPVSSDAPEQSTSLRRRRRKTREEKGDCKKVKKVKGGRSSRHTVAVVLPLSGLRKVLQPKSVIFTTMRLSTTQLVDLRRPCTWMSLAWR